MSICLVAARETVIQSTHTKCRAFRSNGPNLGTFCCQGLLRPHVDQALRWIIKRQKGENGLPKEHRQEKEYKGSVSLHLTMSLTPDRHW